MFVEGSDCCSKNMIAIILAPLHRLQYFQNIFRSYRFERSLSHNADFDNVKLYKDVDGPAVKRYKTSSLDIS